MTSEQASPDSPTAERAPDWRRQAGFLGAVLAIAAAVIAAGLRFAPQASAYSGLSPWVFAGLLGFVLVLAGACVLLAVTLSGPAGPVRESGTATAGDQPQPPPPPWNPDNPGVLDAGPAPAEAPQRQRNGAAGRGLTIVGGVLGLVGLALAALAVLLAVVLPTPTESIMVQFTDLYGRVQLEYCPSLPGSFAATAAHDDLVGSATILPVKVTADVCGNPDYTDGVWIYLNRNAVTVSDLP
ncbi:hypothetical protein [Cryobacterium arcticum]|uniref:Uncharacterized protein n=1 Tax=Cryobacterium arcticum TaxID=670052 RepID=A0A317ZNK9_9MICO|nr:hypothetical protein [Cryobacterium arcticum]PXA67488.1 hypothetical protein CTB96_12240 [Cryobacterium arcticum]